MKLKLKKVVRKPAPETDTKAKVVGVKKSIDTKISNVKKKALTKEQKLMMLLNKKIVQLAKEKKDVTVLDSSVKIDTSHHKANQEKSYVIHAKITDTMIQIADEYNLKCDCRYAQSPHPRTDIITDTVKGGDRLICVQSYLEGYKLSLLHSLENSRHITSFEIFSLKPQQVESGIRFLLKHKEELFGITDNVN